MRLSHPVLLLGVFLFTTVAASAQTADEIVEKTVTALGGRAALAKIDSRLTTGTMSVSTPGGDVSGTIEILNARPNRLRRAITLDLSSLGAGTATIEQRFDGTHGYVMDSLRGDSELSGSQLENLKNGLFPTPFLDYKERGTKILLGGKEKLADKDVFALSITPASGPVTRLFVDAQTYLPARAVVTIEIPELGEQEQTTDFADYREVDGIKVPFSIKGTSAVQTLAIVVTKVEHNVKVDPALFVKK